MVSPTSPSPFAVPAQEVPYGYFWKYMYSTYDTSSHNQNVQVQHVYYCCLCVIFYQNPVWWVWLDFFLFTPKRYHSKTIHQLTLNFFLAEYLKKKRRKLLLWNPFEAEQRYKVCFCLTPKCHDKRPRDFYLTESHEIFYVLSRFLS